MLPTMEQCAGRSLCVRSDSQRLHGVCRMFSTLKTPELAIVFATLSPHPPTPPPRWEGVPQVTFQRPLAHKGFL